MRLRIFIFLAITASAIFAFIQTNISLIESEHYDLNGIESYFVQNIVRNVNGLQYYSDPYNYPFFIFTYTPLYFIVSDLFYNLKSLSYECSIESLFQIYHHYRWMSTFFAIFSIFILFRFLYSSRNSLNHFLIGAIVLLIVFFSFPSTIMAVRGDSLAMLFFSMLILVVSKSLNHGFFTIKNLIVCAFLGSLAFFSKQTSVTFIGALPIYFLLKREFKTLVYFCSIQAIFIALGLGIFVFIYGQEFIPNCFQLAKTDFDINWGMYTILSLFQTKNYIFIIVALLLACFNYWSRIVKIEFYSILFIFCLATNVFFSFKHGSWINYFNEAIISGCLLIYIWMKDFSFRNKKLTYLLLGLYFSLIIFFKLSSVFLPNQKPIFLTSTEKATINKQIDFILMNLNGKSFFSDNEYLNTALANHLFYPYVYKNKTYECIISDKVKVAIDQGKLKYLVLQTNDENELTNFFGIDIRNKYKLVNTIGKLSFYLYVPNPL